MKHLLGSLFLILLVLAAGLVLVIYAQGNRLDKDGKLSGSGILQIDTTPDKARLLIDGKKRGETDTSLENLKPGKYTVKVEKDRYQTWEKVIEVKEGLVTPLRVTLFPTNPSLTSLTFEGVYSPSLSADNKKVVYGIQAGDKKGLWVLNLTDPQLFFSNASPKQIVVDTASLPFSSSTFVWSPDSDQILTTVKIPKAESSKSFLLQADQLNSNPEEVTTRVEEIKAAWQKEVSEQLSSLLKDLGEEAQTLSRDAKSVSFSKDETAVLIVKTDGSALVYDSKPSPVPNVKPQFSTLPSADQYFWFQGNNKNLILIEKNTISILDTDGTNRVNIFTGDFDPNSVYSWAGGSKLVISINLNSKANPLPNLYTIDLD
ncbi:MAG TPA: PEGA domain-containing protein [Candidatus Nanoarchaeia archaeon]|nr:hypothetical protein [uncultured archaeon]